MTEAPIHHPRSAEVERDDTAEVRPVRGAAIAVLLFIGGLFGIMLLAHFLAGSWQ
jgi:hypothetical protein